MYSSEIVSEKSAPERVRPHTVVLLVEPTASLDLPVESVVPRDFAVHVTQLSHDAPRAAILPIATADLIVAYARYNPAETIETWRLIASQFPNKPWLVILPRDVEPEALRTISKFVDDFVLWPCPSEEIAQRIRRLAGETASSSDSTIIKLLREIGLSQLVGEDPAFLHSLQSIPLLAASSAPVLITGETGTGKEFSAQAIHHLGPDKNSPFVPVDCGAIPDQVFENEMFGHMRGGYTDAHSDQKGLAQIAHGGTLFLDEINSLSVVAQAKLLRFLQEGMFKPLGASRFVQVNVRIIAATNQDLETCVRKGQFRADLYYRLNVLRLSLPPLRERPLDIPLLAKHFLHRSEAAGKAKSRTFSSSALRKLQCYSWPGNVRELHNVVLHAAVLASGPQILPEHILLPGPENPVAEEAGFHVQRDHAIAAFERTYVEHLLRNCGGNVTEAAKRAQQNRRSIGRLIKKYKIDRRATADA